MDLIEVRRQLICDAELFLRSFYNENNALEELTNYLSTLHPDVDLQFIRAICISEIEAYKDELSSLE